MSDFWEYLALVQDAAVAQEAGLKAPASLRREIATIHKALNGGRRAPERLYPELWNNGSLPPNSVHETASDGVLCSLFYDRCFEAWLSRELSLLHSNIVFEDSRLEKHTRYVLPYVTSWGRLPRLPPNRSTAVLSQGYKTVLARIENLLSIRAEDLAKTDRVFLALLGILPSSAPLNIYGRPTDDLRAALARVFATRAAESKDEDTTAFQAVRRFDELIMALGVPGDWHLQETTVPVDTGDACLMTEEAEVVWQLATYARTHLGAATNTLSSLFRGSLDAVAAYCRRVGKADPLVDMATGIEGVSLEQFNFNPPVEALFAALKAERRGVHDSYVNVVFRTHDDPRSTLRRVWYAATIRTPETWLALEEGLRTQWLKPVIRKHRLLAVG